MTLRIQHSATCEQCGGSRSARARPSPDSTLPIDAAELRRIIEDAVAEALAAQPAIRAPVAHSDIVVRRDDIAARSMVPPSTVEAMLRRKVERRARTDPSLQVRARSTHGDPAVRAMVPPSSLDAMRANRRTAR